MNSLKVKSSALRLPVQSCILLRCSLRTNQLAVSITQTRRTLWRCCGPSSTTLQ